MDAERVDRFSGLGAEGGEGPWPLLFTGREIAHNRSLPDPAAGFCASFCTKEAMVKALGVPIDYRDCELLFTPPAGVPRVLIPPKFLVEHGVYRALARIMYGQGNRECVVAVSLFGRS